MAKASNRNIIAVIISVGNGILYDVTIKQGIINQLYAKNKFTTCKETYISLNEAPGKSKKMYSQGFEFEDFQHCNWKSECKSNCYKRKIKSSL